MASGRRERSRGELIRQRARAQFVGRRAQLALFAENLTKDPASDTDPAEFLFHVRGVGGIGKSTLLGQWRGAAQRANALTAVVDEADGHGVHAALTSLARQLAEQAGPLKEFDRAAEQYRRDREAAAEPVLADGLGPGEGAASAGSRAVAQAALGATSLIPGAGVVTAMASPEAAAHGLDRLRMGLQQRGRRGRGPDTDALSRAFVAELRRLSGRHPWVVLFLDTWEQTGRALDGWLRELLGDGFGPLPVQVIVVLAGRDPLPEREWAALRPQIADVPLEVFTEAETRELLAARGVTDPAAVDAVRQLSLGLPLLVALLARTQPRTAEEVDADGDVVDTAVARFVRWIPETRHRETVLACALAPQLNEDVFAALVPAEDRDSWEWLCRQPFVTGRGGFRHYHQVVRASMVRSERTRSPQSWTAAHLRLAEAHDGWRAAREEDLPEADRGRDPVRLRHWLTAAYHRLCAGGRTQLTGALETCVHAAEHDTGPLRQWIDLFGQAAADTGDATLLDWAGRLQAAVTAGRPEVDVPTLLLRDGRLGSAAQVAAHTQRGLYWLAENDYVRAESDFTAALHLDPRNASTLAHRGRARHGLEHHDAAVDDLTAAFELVPEDPSPLLWRGFVLAHAGRYDPAFEDFTAALSHGLEPHDTAMARFGLGFVHSRRGRHDRAVEEFTRVLPVLPSPPLFLERGRALSALDRDEEALADLDAALALDPRDAEALHLRGVVHRALGNYDQAVADFTAAAGLTPEGSLEHSKALTRRSSVHRLAGRYELALRDAELALALFPEYAYALDSRGAVHLSLGRYEEAIEDLTAALALVPDGAVETLRDRSEAYQRLGRHEEAVADLTAAIRSSPEDATLHGQRSEAHRRAGAYDLAREDALRARAAESKEPRFALLLVMLDTVTGGIEPNLEHWRTVLTAEPGAEPAGPAEPAEPVEPAQLSVEDGFRELLRIVLLEPETEVTAAPVADCTKGAPSETLAELLPVLAELAALDGPRAARAGRCHELVRRRLREIVG